MVRTLVATAMLVVALSLSASPRVEATSFAPETSVSLANPAVGANSSIVTTFTLGVPDGMFETMVTFIPSEFGVAPGSSVPDGAVVGTLPGTMTLGLIGSACNQWLEPEWELLDGSTKTCRHCELRGCGWRLHP